MNNGCVAQAAPARASPSQAHISSDNQSSGGGTMPDTYFSSGATNRPEENTGGVTRATLSMREIAEQKLNQLGCYIRAACRAEDDRWKSFEEHLLRSTERRSTERRSAEARW
jgi:hypothetical protein